MPNPLKEALLGQGWAGKTITRAETVERVNPFVEQHIRLNHHHRAAIRALEDASKAKALEQLQKTARADIGKLSETVLSCGGSAYNGTDLEPEDFDAEGDDDTILTELADLESEFQDDLKAELDDVEHQMRTRAVLKVVRQNSTERLQVLRKMTRGA